MQNEPFNLMCNAAANLQENKEKINHEKNALMKNNTHTHSSTQTLC